MSPPAFSGRNKTQERKENGEEPREPHQPVAPLNAARTAQRTVPTKSNHTVFFWATCELGRVAVDLES